MYWRGAAVHHLGPENWTCSLKRTSKRCMGLPTGNRGATGPYSTGVVVAVSAAKHALGTVGLTQHLPQARVAC